MANCTDVIGYCPADSGVILCTDCAADDDGTPIFGSSETDTPTHCDNCGTLIPESLTSDGVEYVASALLDYVTAALFVNADGTAKHGGSPSVLDSWRAEYSDAIRYASERHAKIADAFDTVREREREMIGVVLVTIDGMARRYGDDVHGCHWMESAYDGDGMPEECCYCGTLVWNGWQCLDGGEVCCSSHVRTPDDMRAVAGRFASEHGGSVYAASLGKLATDGIVDGIAVDAAESWLSVVTRGRWNVGTIDDARNARHELGALVEFCTAMRSRVYADSLLAIRDIAKDSSVPSHSRIARIQLALDAIGLPTP